MADVLKAMGKLEKTSLLLWQKTNVAFLRDDGYEEDGVDEGGLTTELHALFWLGLGLGLG